MTNTHTRDELLHEMQNDIAGSFASGRLNNIADIVLSIVAILSSLIAAILVGMKQMSGLVAAVAAVPAACGALQRVVDFRGRSDWYFQFCSRTRALAFSLKYADSPNLGEFARLRGELELEMENQWSQVGRSGARGSVQKPTDHT